MDADNLPEIKFDLSFLTERTEPELVFDESSIFDKREAVDVEKPVVRDFHMRDDRQRQESNLEEWFRERAAEIARSAAERPERFRHAFEGIYAHQAR